MTIEERIQELEQQQRKAFENGNKTIANFLYGRIKELKYIQETQ